MRPAREQGDTSATPSTDPIEALAREMATLRDLFQRRLLHDRTRDELYDRLYAQLEFARTDLARRFAMPLLRELLLVIDRVDAALAEAEPDALEPAAARTLLGSIRDELGEVLLRQGLRPAPDPVGSTFDPAAHEAVDRIPVGSTEDDGRVTGHRRPGYFLDDLLLRPA